MKKLKLNELNLGNVEVLTREQLKKVLGGDGSGGGNCCDNQECPSGSGENASCTNPQTNQPGKCTQKWCAGDGCNYYYYECD